MDFTYKKLIPEDIDLLKELLRVFGTAFDDPDAYQSAMPSDEYLKRILSKSDFIAVVALSNGVVVGGLAAYVLEKFEQERREMYIYDLAVLEAFRRRGIARNLILELKKLAQHIKTYVIYVQADHGDMPAIKLYESLGTREDVYHFDIEV